MAFYFDPLIIVFFVLLILVPIASLGVGIAFIVQYIHEDDKKRAWIPKIIVCVAFVLSSCCILLLPVDLIAANAGGLGLGHVMDLLLGGSYQFFYFFVALMVIVVMPFTIFYYEAEDPDKGILHQIIWGAIFTAVIVVVCVPIIIATYFAFGLTEIGYVSYTSAESAVSISAAKAVCETCKFQHNALTFYSSFIVYVASCIAFAGWITFALLGGCGLTALPVTCIKACICKPKRIRSNEFVDMKVAIMKRAERLIELGNQIEEKRDEGELGRKDIRLYNEFKEAVYIVERDWENLEKSYYRAGGSVIIPIIQMIAGIIFAILSVILLLHIILSSIIPVDLNVLNIAPLSIIMRYADYVTINVPVIGGAIYSIFGLYMMFCVLAGSRYVASRLPFCAIHPLKPKDTLMNSMVFNLMQVLLSSVAITQFSVYIFVGYTSHSTLGIMFNTVIRNYRIMGYFFRYVHYIFLIFAVVGFVMSMIMFREKTVDDKRVNDLFKRLAGGKRKKPLKAKKEKAQVTEE